MEDPDSMVNGPNGTPPRASQQLRRFYDRLAPHYDQWLSHYQRWMKIDESRARVAGVASGRTLEVGVGTGVNFSYYPPQLELTAIDLSAAMLELARRRATQLGLRVDLRVGDGERLEFRDGQFDTVIATLFLSVVPHHRRALAEVFRVLKPGGRLMVVDHVRSEIGAVRFIQAALDPILVRYAGWHWRRDLASSLRARGFVIEAYRRRRLGTVAELVGRR